MVGCVTVNVESQDILLIRNVLRALYGHLLYHINTQIPQYLNIYLNIYAQFSYLNLDVLLEHQRTVLKFSNGPDVLAQLKLVRVPIHFSHLLPPYDPNPLNFWRLKRQDFALNNSILSVNFA